MHTDIIRRVLQLVIVIICLNCSVIWEIRADRLFDEFIIESDTSILGFSPNPISVPTDSIFSIGIVVDSVTNLFSIATNVFFSSTQLQFIGIEEDLFLNSNNSVGTSLTYNVNVSEGNVLIGLTRLGSENGGVSTVTPRTLFTLKFKKLQTDTTFLAFGNTGLLRPDGYTQISFKSVRAVIFTNLTVNIISAQTTQSEYLLLWNYPNPFNAGTMISYSLPRASDTKLSITDVLGKEIDVLANRIYQPGSYTTFYRNDNLSSGTYFLKVEADHFITMKKILLIK